MGVDQLQPLGDVEEHLFEVTLTHARPRPSVTLQNLTQTASCTERNLWCQITRANEKKILSDEVAIKKKFLFLFHIYNFMNIYYV